MGRRERLAEVVDAILELARETATELGEDDLQLPQRLREPFRVLALGEVGCGKSTLLNGLFASNACQAGKLPRAASIQHFCHGEPSDEPAADGVLVCRRPERALRDFELIDTPGSNGALKGQERLVEAMFASVDVILVVFPVSNPWGAASWDLLGRVPAERLGRVVLVLQQCDEREADELRVIGEHVRDLANKRLGVAPAVFPVAAQAGQKARAAGMAAGWQTSGMAALAAHVEALVCESPQGDAELRDLRRAAAGILRRIEDRMDEQVRQAEDHYAFLRQLEAEVDHEREKHIRRLGREGDGLGDVLATAGSATARFLRGRLGLVRSLAGVFLPDTTAPLAEKFLIDALKGGMEARAAAEAAGLLAGCRAHWEALQPRVRARMGIEIPPFDGCEKGLASVRAEFIDRLGSASRQPVLNLRLRAGLAGLLERRRRLLGRLMGVALGLQSVAGVAGFLDWDWLAWGLVGGAALVVAVAVWQAWRSRRQVLGEFADDLLSARGRFAEMLAGDYQSGVRNFFLEYATMFQAVRQRIAEGREQLRPRMERWNELFLALKALEQEL